MKTFALILLASLLGVLCLRPFVSAPAAAGTTSVRIFDARNPSRSIVDDRHEWIWETPQPARPGGLQGHGVGHGATEPVLLRRDRASGAVVGRYAPATERDGALGVEWSDSRRLGNPLPYPLRLVVTRETRTAMVTYVNPIEERRPIF